MAFTHVVTGLATPVLAKPESGTSPPIPAVERPFGTVVLGVVNVAARAALCAACWACKAARDCCNEAAARWARAVVCTVCDVAVVAAVAAWEETVPDPVEALLPDDDGDAFKSLLPPASALRPRSNRRLAAQNAPRIRKEIGEIFFMSWRALVRTAVTPAPFQQPGVQTKSKLEWKGREAVPA